MRFRGVLLAALLALVVVDGAAAADRTRPTVRLTTPANGATVSGGVRLEATAADDVGVVRVDFLVDGVRVDRDDEAPYTGAWDSGTVANGTHYLAAVASDAAGNTATSTVAVKTSNAVKSQRVELLANGAFESGTTGWVVEDGTAAVASDGKVGAKAALVTTGSSGWTSLYTRPIPVGSSTAGGVYVGTAWVRSAQAGLQLCLHVNEWTHGDFYDSRHSCLTSTTGWQQIQARAYMATAPGTQIDLDVTAVGAPAGATYEVDGASLTGPPSPPAPANDQFSSAGAISGRTGTLSGTNVGASKATGEPAHAGNAGGHSVWFTWTPADNGTATLTTDGSAFDTLLAVYTGGWGTFASVAASDDANGLRTSTVSFPVHAGTTYAIAVDGKNGATGSFKLAWSTAVAAPPPANDYFSDAATISGASGSIGGTNVSATKAGDEPAHAGNPGGASVWYAWVAPANGAVTFTIDTASFATVLAAYTGGWGSFAEQASAVGRSITFTAHAGTRYGVVVDGRDGATGTFSLSWSQTATPVPANDFLSDAPAIGGATGSVDGTTVGASKGDGEPNHAGNAGGASVWYEWTAPAGGPVTFTLSRASFAPLLAAYTGGWGAFVERASSTSGSITFTASAGGTYAIAVDGKDGATGTFTLGWSQTAVGPPPNDFFSDRTALGGATGSVTGSTAGATKGDGEPAHAGNAGGASVWYAWTAPANGTVTFSTAGSSFATLLAAYTGDWGTFAEQASSTSGSISFAATAGTTYAIAVDGVDGATGSLQLAWTER